MVKKMLTATEPELKSAANEPMPSRASSGQIFHECESTTKTMASPRTPSRTNDLGVAGSGVGESVTTMPWCSESLAQPGRHSDGGGSAATGERVRRDSGA